MSDPPNPGAPRCVLPQARPQSLLAFVAKGYFGGVGLARGAYMEYVSANAAKSGKSVSPKVEKEPT